MVAFPPWISYFDWNPNNPGDASNHRSWYVALLQINIANILQKLFTMDKFLCKIDANSQQQFYTKMNQYFLFRIILAVDKGSAVEGCNSFTYINIGLMKTVSQNENPFFIFQLSMKNYSFLFNLSTLHLWNVFCE